VVADYHHILLSIPLKRAPFAKRIKLSLHFILFLLHLYIIHLSISTFIHSKMALLPALATSALAAAPSIIIEEKKVGNRQKPKKNQNKKRKNKQTNNKKASSKRTGRTRLNAMSARNTYGPNILDAKQVLAFRKMCEDAIGTLMQGQASAGSGPVLPVRRKFRIGGATVSFQFAHLAQKEVDRSFKNGIRVTITDVDGGTGTSSAYLTVGTSNTATALATVGYRNGAAAGTTSASVIRVRPIIMSDIAGLLAQVFEFYAPRYSKFRFRAETGSYGADSATTDTNFSLAMGFSRDADSNALNASPNFKYICGYETHCVGHITEDMEFEVAHTGSSTWSCNPQDAADEECWGNLCIAADKGVNNAGGVNIIYGHVEVFHVIDFYGLRQVTAGGGTLQSLIAACQTTHRESLESLPVRPAADHELYFGSDRKEPMSSKASARSTSQPPLKK